MLSFRPRIALLVLLCLTQAGCLESVVRGHSPNSGRTDTAYSGLPIRPRPVNKTVEDYLKRLEEVQQAPQALPMGQRIQPTAIPIVPLDETELQTPSRGGAFGSGALRRRVTIPASALPKEQPKTPTPTAPIQRPTMPAPPARPDKPIGQAGPGGDRIGQFVRDVQSRAAARPEDLDLQLQSRLLLACAGMDAEALQPIAGLDNMENKKVADLLKMVMALRDKPKVEMTPAEATERLAALESLREQLKSMADLQIPVVKLCREVVGYGVYVPFNNYNFLAGQSQLVIVYCELKNFAAVPDETGMNRTRLNLKLALYNAQGKLAQPVQEDKDIEDISANRRDDFYLTRVFELRDTLSAGEYTLKVTVEDHQANKVRSKNITITLSDPQ